MGGVPRLATHLGVDAVAETRIAVQVQRWLGHHSSETYVRLLDGDLGEPLSIPGRLAGANMAPTADLQHGAVREATPHAGLVHPQGGGRG